MPVISLTAHNITGFDAQAFNDLNQERFGGQLVLTEDTITIPDSLSEPEMRDAAMLVESMLFGASMD